MESGTCLKLDKIDRTEYLSDLILANRKVELLCTPLLSTATAPMGEAGLDMYFYPNVRMTWFWSVLKLFSTSCFLFSSPFLLFFPFCMETHPFKISSASLVFWLQASWFISLRKCVLSHFWLRQGIVNVVSWRFLGVEKFCQQCFEFRVSAWVISSSHLQAWGQEMTEINSWHLFWSLLLISLWRSVVRKCMWGAEFH